MSKYFENLNQKEIYLLEELADIEHQRWADWQEYCFQKLGIKRTGVPIDGDDDKSSNIRRWFRQIDTSYADLSEEEKDSDREQVMRYWSLINHYKKDKIMNNEMNFSEALFQLKAGKKCARSGWNGKDMFCVLSPGEKGLPADKFFSEHLKDHANKLDGKMNVRPSFLIKTAQEDVAYWTPSTSDILAEDWVVI